MFYRIILDPKDLKNLMKGEVVTKTPSRFCEIQLTLSDMGYELMEQALFEAKTEISREMK